MNYIVTNRPIEYVSFIGYTRCSFENIYDACTELRYIVTKCVDTGQDIHDWHIEREFTEAEMAPKESNEVWEEVKSIKEDIRTLKYDIATLRRGKL